MGGENKLWGGGQRLSQIMILPHVQKGLNIISNLDEEVKRTPRAGAMIPRCHSSTSLVLQSAGPWAPRNSPSFPSLAQNNCQVHEAFSSHTCIFIEHLLSAGTVQAQRRSTRQFLPLFIPKVAGGLIKTPEGTHSPHRLNTCCSWLYLLFFC